MPLHGDDSYLIIPAFLAPEETDALLNRTKSLLDKFSLRDHPLVRLNQRRILITSHCHLCSFVDEIHHR